jgi:hypothetical protein
MLLIDEILDHFVPPLCILLCTLANMCGSHGCLSDVQVLAHERFSIVILAKNRTVSCTKNSSVRLRF